MGEKKVILWIEDHGETVALLKKYCINKGYSIVDAKMPHTILSRINEYNGSLVLIVLDIMLYGVNDLSNIGLNGCDTDMGLTAGWVILDRLLRPVPDDELPESYVPPNPEIPILILSTPMISEEHLDLIKTVKKRHPTSGLIKHIEKGSISNGEIIWEDQFKAVFKEIMKI